MKNIGTNNNNIMKYLLCLLIFSCQNSKGTPNSYFDLFPSGKQELERMGYVDSTVRKDKAYSYYRRYEQDTVVQFDFYFSDKIYSKRITIFCDSLGIDGMREKFSFLKGRFIEQNGKIIFIDKDHHEYLVWTANSGRVKRPVIQFQYESPELKKINDKFRKSPPSMDTDTVFTKKQL